MDPIDDPGEYYRELERERQLDQELRDRDRPLRLEAEIARMKTPYESVRDSIEDRIFWKLTDARVLIKRAFEIGAGFADALDAANEVLQLDPSNSEALTICAIALAKLESFDEAVRAAEAAIALDPCDKRESGVWMRRELPVWKKAVRE